MKFTPHFQTSRFILALVNEKGQITGLKQSTNKSSLFGGIVCFLLLSISVECYAQEKTEQAPLKNSLSLSKVNVGPLICLNYGRTIFIKKTHLKAELGLLVFTPNRDNSTYRFFQGALTWGTQIKCHEFHIGVGFFHQRTMEIIQWPSRSQKIIWGKKGNEGIRLGYEFHSIGSQLFLRFQSQIPVENKIQISQLKPIGIIGIGYLL